MKKTYNDFIDRKAQFGYDGWDVIHRSIASGRRMVMGDVFSMDQKEWHRARRKPILTYNIALSHFKQYAGGIRQAKVQEKIYPLTGGDVETAAGLTRVLNSYAGRGFLQAVHSRVADDTWVGGLGVYECFHNRLVEDPFGQVMAVAGNPLQHMFDLSALEPGGGDIMDAMKVSYMDRRALARMFPEIELKDPGYLDHMVRQYSHGGRTLSTLDVNTIVQNPIANDHNDFDVENVTGIRSEYGIPVCEWYHREIEKRKYVYHFEGAKWYDVTRDKDSDISQIVQAIKKQGQHVAVIEKPFKQMHLSISLGEEVVEEDIVYEPNCLPYSYSFGYKLGGVLLGEGVSLIDPSRGFSKTMSAMTEQISKSANKGLITVGDIDNDMDEGTRQALDDIAAGRGGHANLPNHGSNVHVVDYNSSSPGMSQYAMQMLEVMKIVASSPDNQRGVSEGSHQSGLHAQTMIAQAMIGGEYLRENWLQARRCFATTMIKYIQHYDGNVPFRIFNILNDGGNPEEVIFNIQLADNVKGSLGGGTYDAVVDFQSYTVTDRRARAQELIGAAQNAGQPLPLEILLRISEMPGSEQILKEYQEARRREEQMRLLSVIAGEKQTA